MIGPIVPWPRLLRRAVIIALTVGTILLCIHHGDHLRAEPICPGFYWKTGLSYLVPFCVSVVSSLLTRRDVGHARDRAARS